MGYDAACCPVQTGASHPSELLLLEGGASGLSSLECEEVNLVEINEALLNELERTVGWFGLQTTVKAMGWRAG